jgi:hypothetical protein
MTIMTMGRSLAGEPLFTACSDERGAAALEAALAVRIEAVRAVTRAADAVPDFHGAEDRRRRDDRNDPLDAGWAYLVRADDPRSAELEGAIAPLAARRSMAGPPLYYRGERANDWFDWLTREYFGRRNRGVPVPGFVLMLGSPEQIPFEFQSLLQTLARVGRLDFEDTGDLRRYVDKLLRLERADAPAVEREAVLFGPDAGVEDATHHSRRLMVEPLAHKLRGRGFATSELLGEHATKQALVDALAGHRPALLYAASHGVGAVGESLAVQRAYNGAICCQETSRGGLDDVFSAADVDFARPVLEGAVVFQFACYGYGTPASSEYAHWLGSAPAVGAGTEFVAALPTRLLAHPRGPIAFVGHVDLAFMHAFSDGAIPAPDQHWHDRLEPFASAVDRLVAIEPTGRALEDMNARYAGFNAMIAAMYDDKQRTGRSLSLVERDRLIENWILRGDAKNYMLLGDPAAGLRIPSRIAT